MNRLGVSLRSGVQRGFTLVELLVVFAIAALLVGLAPLAFGKLKESAQYRDTLRALVADLRQARQLSITRGVETRFQMDLSHRLFGVQGQPGHPVPLPLEVRASVGSSELSPDQVAGILFLPDGGATGGSFDLIRPSGTGVRVRVDWLSGRVEQEALSP